MTLLSDPGYTKVAQGTWALPEQLPSPRAALQAHRRVARLGRRQPFGVRSTTLRAGQRWRLRCQAFSVTGGPPGGVSYSLVHLVAPKTSFVEIFINSVASALPQ
jgi:hypothetical protein